MDRFGRAVGQRSLGSATLGYDAAGNTTADQRGHALVYDVWNRLVEVKQGETPLVRHAYDALGWR